MSDITPSPERTKLVCSNCDHVFEVEPGAPERCPACLRTSGLVRRAPGRHEGSGIQLPWKGIGALVAALAVAAGVWFWIGTASNGPSDAPVAESASEPVSTAQESDEAAAAALAKVPAELRLRPDVVDAAIQAAAAKLPEAPAALVAEVARARTDGRLPARDTEDDLFGAPFAAGQLVRGLEPGASDVTRSGSLEVVTLAAALLKARGHEEISFGVDTTPKGAATDVRRHHYLVRVGDGPWLSPSGGGPENVQALSEAAFLAHVLVWRALGAMAAVDPDLAARAASQAVSLAPDDAAVQFVVGASRLASGLVDLGLSEMEEAANRKADAHTWYQLGSAALQVSQPFKAHQYLIRAKDMDPGFALPHVLLAQLAFERLTVTPRDTHAAVLEQIQQHLKDAEAIDPNAIGIRTLRAQLLIASDEVDQAQSLLEQEVDLHPSSGQSWMVLMDFLRSRGDLAAAVETAKRAEAAGHRDPQMMRMVAMMLAESGDYEAALSRLQKVLGLQPDAQDLRLQIAQLQKVLGDGAACLSTLEEQLRRFPDDVAAGLLMAQLDLEGGQADAARARAQAILDREPNLKEAAVFVYLAALASGTGVEDARVQAVASVGRRSLLGQVLLEQGMTDEAERLLGEAVEKDPADEMAPIMLGTLYLLTGREAESASLRARIVAAAPEDIRKNVDHRFKIAYEQAMARR